FGSPSQTHHARQQVCGTHIAAGEADLGEQEGEPARSAHDPKVGGQGDDRAGTGGDALDFNDDGDRAFAHGADDIAGHFGEAHELVGVHGDQLTDDFVDVAAGAETLTFALDDQHLDVVVVGQLGQQVAQ